MEAAQQHLQAAEAHAQEAAQLVAAMGESEAVSAEYQEGVAQNEAAASAAVSEAQQQVRAPSVHVIRRSRSSAHFLRSLFASRAALCKSEGASNRCEVPNVYAMPCMLCGGSLHLRYQNAHRSSKASRIARRPYSSSRRCCSWHSLVSGTSCWKLRRLTTS